MHRILRQAGVQRILDAGCGNGALAAYLVSKRFDVVGIDASQSGIKNALVQFPNLDFRVGNFDQRPPGKFDAVVSTEVVEHLYSPHTFAEYCFEALRPGGIAVISTPYHGYFKNLVLAALGKWDDHLTALWHGGHIKFWSRKTLGRLLKNAGFDVISFHGAGRFPLLWKSMIIVAKRP